MVSALHVVIDRTWNADRRETVLRDEIDAGWEPFPPTTIRPSGPWRSVAVSLLDESAFHATQETAQFRALLKFASA
jgi:hypothetical protein